MEYTVKYNMIFYLYVRAIYSYNYCLLYFTRTSTIRVRVHIKMDFYSALINEILAKVELELALK